MHNRRHYTVTIQKVKTLIQHRPKASLRRHPTSNRKLFEGGYAVSGCLQSFPGAAETYLHGEAVRANRLKEAQRMRYNGIIGCAPVLTTT